jgi:small-conductance mechanosensitive channel
MEGLTQQIQDLFGFGPEAQARLLRSALIIAFLVLLHLVFLRLIRNLDVRARYRWRKTSTYIGVVLGIFLVGRIWFEGFQTVATFLGLLSAGLVIALRDLVVNIAGWFFIVWRRPFVVGDRIQIGDVNGNVIPPRSAEAAARRAGQAGPGL